MGKIIYKRDEKYNQFIDYSLDKNWMPSIYMSKKYCRLFLKVKNIRIERIQDISGIDAKLEGITVSDGSNANDYIEAFAKS